MVHAGVFRNVAIAGTKPCSSSGVSTMPVQNMACVCAWYSPLKLPQAQQQAEKVDGINAREPRLPEALAVQFAAPRPLGVVVSQHESRQQNEVADRDESGVDHRRQKPEPLGIGEVEKNDIDGREAAQARECLQRRWLDDCAGLLVSTCS